jgi:hypothetical protein
LPRSLTDKDTVPIRVTEKDGRDGHGIAGAGRHCAIPDLEEILREQCSTQQQPYGEGGKTTSNHPKHVEILHEKLLSVFPRDVRRSPGT